MSSDEDEDNSTLRPGGIMPMHALDHTEDMEWLSNATLIIVVVGASGDLAKKKTYPSLMNLYDDNLLPENVRIFGLARSELSDDELRDRLRPFLKEGDHSEEVVEKFLKRCFYHASPSYGDIEAYEKLKDRMEDYENVFKEDPTIRHRNRLFYFAIPPSVFSETAVAIKKTGMQDEDKGWTRLIVEKPFGRDLESFEELNKTLSEHFTEDHLYRIDHYLGKELVQNLQVLRFSNIWFERVWNSQTIETVMLTFKEPFGTEGRGGYFDEYGIIRDICQNHLLQVLTLLAMETPSVVEGPKAGKAVRDNKVAVLNSMSPLTMDDVLLGQYEGYADDPSIKNKDTNTPTFAILRFWVNTPRWHGVPFIMKAGKALNERKAEMRIQFKDAPAAEFVFQGDDCPRNELVMRMQPHEAIYMKTNVKSPGFAAKPVQSELEVNYESRFFAHTKEANPDAYTRLILDVLQRRHAAFVRDDELRRAWEIFTPLLHKIERENIKPFIYKKGTRGPVEGDAFIREKAGYIRNEDYVFYEGDVARKTEGTNVAPKPPNATVPDNVPEEALCDVGVFGLSTVGGNFALNIAEKGFKVAAGNRSIDKVKSLEERAKTEGNLPIYGCEGPADLVAHLKRPRKVFIMVQAGRPVDDAVSTFARYMEHGDIIIDGGDEWFPNSIRREKFLKPKGIRLVSMGISGGEHEIRNGPSIMAGGPKAAYDIIEPVLTKIAAQSEGKACTGYLGPIGAGNYVKMVHNGIEYGDMQIIAECYDILKTALQMKNEEIADLFDQWDKGDLSCYLLEITSKILRKKDDETGDGYVIDYILDRSGMKGTGRWTVEEGAKNGVALPTISGALDARILSSMVDERDAASKVLDTPQISVSNRQEVIDDLEAALYASRVCSSAQGLYLIKAASDERKWKVDLAECARLWTAGSIIRSKMLHQIHEAFSRKPGLTNLIVEPFFAKELNKRSTAWRRLIATCVMNGIACPSLSGSLIYFDTYRRQRLPASLTQAQRDFFGNHTYERIDKDGRFHTTWTDEHRDSVVASERAAGENIQTDIEQTSEE